MPLNRKIWFRVINSTNCWQSMRRQCRNRCRKKEVSSIYPTIDQRIATVKIKRRITYLSRPLWRNKKSMKKCLTSGCRNKRNQKKVTTPIYQGWGILQDLIELHESLPRVLAVLLSRELSTEAKKNVPSLQIHREGAPWVHYATLRLQYLRIEHLKSWLERKDRK